MAQPQAGPGDMEQLAAAAAQRRWHAGPQRRAGSFCAGAGIGVAGRSTGTAVTLFCGEPSITRSE
ncbi:MAG: hypothetical protein MZW92_69555 [Comamonadaceae bacterium]|nr:hypothetical protein [Comamonadaceae bacterium]